jgi:hypothetical protein
MREEILLMMEFWDKNEFKMSSFDLASLLTVAASIKIIKTCNFASGKRNKDKSINFSIVGERFNK